MEEQIISSLFVCHTADKIWGENRRVIGKAVGSYTVGGLLVLIACDRILLFLSKTSHLYTLCSTWKNGKYEIFSWCALQKLMLAAFTMLC